MSNQQGSEKHQINISQGYTSKLDELKHRAANLSVFGPKVAFMGIAMLFIELLTSHTFIGALIFIVGIGMIGYGKVLEEVIKRWKKY